MFSGIAKFLLAASITARALQTPDELHQQYYTIFPSGNRNAASHRWATYVLECSLEMTDATLRNLFSSFCAVSGSPVYPSAGKRWKMILPQVTGGPNMTGMMYYCCSPCVCDTYDFIKIDTKTITTQDGPKQYYFTVIGNPCLKPDALTETWLDPFSGGLTSLAMSAPDVKCSGEALEKATLSDHGHIILSMFFENDTPGHATSDIGFQDSGELLGYCAKRAESGYASGMGEIFRKVAAIQPIQPLGNSDSYTSGSNDASESNIISSTTISTANIGPTLVTSTASTTLSTTISSITTTSGSSASGGESNGNSIDGDTAGVTKETTTVRTSETFMESSGGTNGVSSNSRNIAGNPTMFSCFFAAFLVTRFI